MWYIYFYHNFGEEHRLQQFYCYCHKYKPISTRNPERVPKSVNYVTLTRSLSARCTSFRASTLRQQEGYPACKKSCFNHSQNFIFGGSGLTWSNSGKPERSSSSSRTSRSVSKYDKIKTRDHWIQRITFAAETTAADIHSVTAWQTDAERHNTFSARKATAKEITVIRYSGRPCYKWPTAKTHVPLISGNWR